MTDYMKPATASTPALIVYLLDVSGSMEDMLNGERKIDVVMKALKRTIIKMVQRSTKGSDVSPRYRVAMFAYSTTVTDILGGIKTIEEVAQIGIPQLQTMEITDTAAAFAEAEKLLASCINDLQDGPAPLVCHMTDGEYNGPNDPTPIAQKIMQMSVPDGNVLVENIFISENLLTAPVSDPKNWGGLVDSSYLANNYAKSLFDMSSVIPESYRKVMAEMGYKLDSSARMMLPGVSPEMVELGFAMSAATPTKAQGPEEG